MHQRFYVNRWWWWEEIELHILHPYLILRCVISYMQALPCGTLQLKTAHSGWRLAVFSIGHWNVFILFHKV